MAPYRLLNDPSVVPVTQVPDGGPLPPMTVLPEYRQPCLAAGEPLIPLDDLASLDAYSELKILPPRTLVVRSGLAGRLKHAEALLPAQYCLVVLDAWRSLDQQQLLLEYYGSNAASVGFVATTSPTAIRPPHTTGGAVDLTLLWQEIPLGLGTDFDSFSDTARLDAFEDDDDVLVKQLRRLLASVMSEAGFVCYGKEWWHWSFGDDVWASALGKAAVYDIWEQEASVS